MKLVTYKLARNAILISLPISLYFQSDANAAISIKPLVKLAAVDSATSGIVAAGSQVLVYGNREQGAFARIIGGQAQEAQEAQELVGDLEPFVSAATSDSDGNFYLVGAAATPIVGTLPPISGVLNPDNVVPDPVSSNKSDPVKLWFWKLDNTGKLVDSGSMAMPSPIIPYSVIVDKFGMTIAGASYSDPGSRGFLVNWNEVPTYLGKSSTQIFSITRSADGSVVAVGQSGERLLDKNLRGNIDGFLARISSGKVINLQRSSDVKARRAWRSTNSGLLLGGFSNSQAVITRFNSNFLPTWTDRYPALSGALTSVSGKNFYGAFVSNGPFKSLPAWKRKNSTLLLTFDAKGAITAANYATTTDFRGLASTPTLGPLLLAGGFVYRT